MLNRQAVMDEIGKTLTRSTRLTEQAKARHRGSVEAAFSGAGFSSETATKMAMVKGIRPNRGFRKGSIADQFVDPEIDQFHGSPASAAAFASDPDASINPFDIPVQSHADIEEDRAFRAALRAQYPLATDLVDGLARPQPSATLEARYTQPSGVKLEPTTGEPFYGPGPQHLSIKANRMTLHKGAGMTVIQKLDRLFEIYMTGGSLKAAAAELGISR